MPWAIEISDSAAKQLRKLDAPIARRIVSFLRDRVASATDPRALRAALKGDELGQYRKYRVGDYRLIAQIRDREVRIVVVRMGHRREGYR